MGEVYMEQEQSRVLLRQWLKTQDKADKVYVSLLKRFKLNKALFFALDFLRSHPDGVEPSVLAQSLGLMRQMITIVLNDMDSQGFIMRKEREDDHRRKIIRLSEKGSAFAGKVCKEFEDFDLSALSVFSPDELRNLVEYTNRFYEKIKKQLEASKYRAFAYDISNRNFKNKPV